MTQRMDEDSLEHVTSSMLKRRHFVQGGAASLAFAALAARPCVGVGSLTATGSSRRDRAKS